MIPMSLLCIEPPVFTARGAPPPLALARRPGFDGLPSSGSLGPQALYLPPVRSRVLSSMTSWSAATGASCPASPDECEGSSAKRRRPARSASADEARRPSLGLFGEQVETRRQ